MAVIDEALNTFVKEPKTEGVSCLSFHGSVGYVGLRAETKGTIRFIVSAGRQIAEKLSTEAQQWLYEAGFRRKRASENFEKSVSPSECAKQEQTTFIRAVFTTCFSENVERVDRHVLAPFDVDDQPVLDAMVFLSKQRDWAARKTLLSAVARHRFCRASRRRRCVFIR